MTTYVYVMYVLDKHVHALNLFFFSIFMVDFCLHVRVCRIILKKKSPCERIFFLEFPVTQSHSLSINQLGVTEACFSCHAPITHT